MIICVADDLRIKEMLHSINDYCEVIVVLNGATKEVKKSLTFLKKVKLLI